MIKLWKFLSIFAVVAVCLGLLLVPGLVSHSGNTVYIEIDPAIQSVLPGQNFSFNVTVPITASENVSSAEAHIDFDNTRLNVTGMAKGDLTKMLKCEFNNTAGTIDYAGMIDVPGGDPPVNSTFRLCTVNCTAKQLDGTAAVDFIYIGPKRKTQVFSPTAADYLVDWSTQVVNGTVKIGTHTLTVNVTPPGKGNVTINAVTPPSYPNITTWYLDEVVNLTAVVSVPNWTFDHWSGDLTGSDNPTNITMDSNQSVVAHFARYNLTVTTNATRGTVTEPGVGTFRYPEGESVPLVAASYPGYGLANWTGDVATIGDVNASSTFINMTGDYSIYANFVVVITATLEGNVTFPPARVGDKAELFVVKLFEAGNLSNVLWTGNATTNSTGVFTIPVLTPDTYDIGIKNATCVSELATGEVLTAGNTTVVNFTIREGDIHPTDYVDMEDYADFSYAFRTSPTDVKWNANADLDRSGYIDMVDYAMFSYNFREMGDAYEHF